MAMKGRFKDRTGQRFGRLTATRHAGIGPRGDSRWECRCDCGTTKIFRLSNLVNGNTRSCGCWRNVRRRATPEPEHGLTIYLFDGKTVHTIATLEDALKLERYATELVKWFKESPDIFDFFGREEMSTETP